MFAGSPALALDVQRRRLHTALSIAAWTLIALGVTMMAVCVAGESLRLAFLRATTFELCEALAFSSIGAALLFSTRHWHTASRCFSIVVFLLGTLMLGGVLYRIDFGLDRVFVEAAGQQMGRVSDRVPFLSAGALLLVGISLTLLATYTAQNAALDAAHESIAFCVLVFGAMGLSNLVVGESHLHASGARLPIAPVVDTGFVATGIGLLALVWHRANHILARVPLWLPAALCVFVALFDLSTPRGVAAGIAYVPLVFCGAWFNSRHSPIVYAIVGSVLSLATVAAKPVSEVSLWMVLTNRGISLGAIWLVAILVLQLRASEINQRASDNKMRAVFDSTLDGLVSIDERGTITQANPASERIFGYSIAELLGQNVRMLMPEPHRTEHGSYLTRYLSSRVGRIIGTSGRELTAQRKDGSLFPIDLSINEFKFEGRTHFTGIIRDITERKRAEEAIQKYTADLERSNRELDDFAYIASHDLKEPLRGVFNNAKFLLQDCHDKLDATGIGRLNRLCYLAQRMEALVNDLLYFSRLGRQDLAIKKTDLNSAVREIETMMETTLKEQNATIHIAQPLPEIACDSTRVTELFRNLITNAVKYNNRVEKRVEVGCVPEMETAHGLQRNVLYVRDNGIGIDAEFHEEVFRIFKRLNEEDDSKKGNGVGLTVVRKIVERHGGTIWLDSKLGDGTTFYFTVNDGHGGNGHAALR